ncbi:UDP-glucuronate decarboxylase [Bradyrhizobium ottawaense]|uniref:Nucleoside-diphosphate sugar epimerase n=1 Tax=Bradyrhizobium ottawaense TaxID=931866 RepID=A0A2U8PJ43_9BRAD|nr:NAD-dependent epimerase/dehydratase [Bradyrhizobium ottawaense]AWL97756.1 nucleoside-diphosphate sugar epimerase [Bradyrhizobium ottawaense]MBR1328062.1 NAD-dependent epimerase/dehydratase family protein [Bradyrhizobium ottawaense]MBR1337412.1 NAD-dependent epimerase/dehydratase family protein [Bradyrhizobium ottawaense]
MRRVLVTGASGFVGRALLPVLTGRGFEVHGVARATQSAVAGVTWHAADLLTEAGRAHALSASRPTHLVHLAWEVRPGRYREDPVNRLWAEASIDLLSRARARGTQRILGIGSCLEYGPQSGPCEEQVSQCRPTTLYGQAKLATAEAYIAAGAAWGRVFVPFGPHEPEARLIPSLIRSLRAGLHFDCSHGGQLRDFVYVDDLAQMIAAVLDSELSGVVNLASGETRSLRSVIEHVAGLLEARHLARFGAVDATGIDAEPIIAADVRRLRGVTAGVPVVGFQEGAARDVAWWIDRQPGRG